MAAANRIRPLEAHRAMRALLADPDDTEQAFRVVVALSGNSNTRQFRRFRRTPVGARVLRERRRLSDLLIDPERMAAMPPGSLGAAVRSFYARERIDAGGLAAASALALGDRRRARDPDQELFAERLRDLHDVFHVVTGYGRDLLGEAAVLAFTVPQTRNPGVAFMVGTVLVRAGLRSEFGRMIRSAFRRGLRSEWLPGQDWEGLLERSLTEVRDRLRVGPPPVYQPVRSERAPAVPGAA